MSIHLTVPYRIKCDGDSRWPCMAAFEASSVCLARETRAEAKEYGWKVNVPNLDGRQRLDLCPTCAANQQITGEQHE